MSEQRVASGQRGASKLGQPGLVSQQHPGCHGKRWGLQPLLRAPGLCLTRTTTRRRRRPEHSLHWGSWKWEHKAVFQCGTVGMVVRKAGGERGCRAHGYTSKVPFLG